MTEQPEPQPEAPRPGDADCEASCATTAPPKTAFRRAGRLIWRVFIAIAGSALVLAGIGLSVPFIPGPGFAVILAGLAVLATEFSGPRRLLKWLPRKVREWKEERARRRAQS
jgi:uncharacterized protein (TIGR02611 family)